MEKMGGGQGAGGESKPEGEGVEDEGDEIGQGGGFKLGAVVSQDGAKPVNGGLEIYNKMDIKFQI